MKEARIIPLLKLEDTLFPFKAQCFKLLHEGEEINESAHSHNHFEVIWVVSGKGRLYVDFQKFEIADNMIFCLRPDQAHYFEIHEAMQGFVFSFTDSFFNTGACEFDWPCKVTLSQLFYECQVIKLLPDLETDMNGIAVKMIKEFESMNVYRMELLKRYFRIFLIYVARGLAESTRGGCETREAELVRRFMELLDKNFKGIRTVAEYARQLLVTPNYLSALIRKNTGFSAGHHIRQRVVLEAKRMARYSTSGM